MEEHHVRDAVADLVEGGPDIVAEGQRIVFGSMTGAASGEHDRGSFEHGRTAFGLGAGAQEGATFDERGRQHGAGIEERTGDRLARRSAEERRVGKDGVRTVRSRQSQDHYTKTKDKN